MNRRDLIGGLMILAGASSLEGRPSEWPDTVFNPEDGHTSQESFGSVTVLFEGPTEQLRYMNAGTALLNPGQQPHPPHQHPEEEFMLVTEGRGEIIVGGKTSQAGPGTLMYCEGNHVHGIKNTGTVPMRFFYCKWSVSDRS